LDSIIHMESFCKENCSVNADETLIQQFVQEIEDEYQQRIQDLKKIKN